MGRNLSVCVQVRRCSSQPMETGRLQIPPAPRGGPMTLRRNCTNKRATCCIYLPTRPSPNTGLRLSLFRNSLRRCSYAPNACLRTASNSEDRPPAPTPVSEEEDEIPNLKPKAWFYLFAEAAICSLIWSPSENILRFVFVITSSIALASVEFFRKFVREHIHDMTVRDSHCREVEGTLTSDCSRTASPSSSLEFRQGPSSVIEKGVDKTITLRPKVWFYLFIAAAVCYLFFNPSEIKLLLAFALTSSTALGCVEFFGKFMQKDFHYLRLRVQSRKVDGARTSHCSRTAFPSSSIEFRQGPNPGTEDDGMTTCERKSSIQVYLLLPVVSFFLVVPFCMFIQVMPSLVARCYSLWTPSDEILAISFILIPGLLTAWGLSVKNFFGHLGEFSDSVDCLVQERQKEGMKLKLCTKPQQITEAEETLTTAYSRMTFPSSFHQDKHVSATKDYKTNKFERILLILFCLGVPVLCFYFFLVTVLEAMHYGKPLLYPVALCYSLWTPSGMRLRTLFPITSFLTMAEHLRYMQISEYSARARRKEIKAGKLL